MATKHISHAQVLNAMLHCPHNENDIAGRVYFAWSRPWSLVEYLMTITGEAEKVCARAAERTMERAINDNCVSLNAWGIDEMSECDRKIYFGV